MEMKLLETTNRQLVNRLNLFIIFFLTTIDYDLLWHTKNMSPAQRTYFLLSEKNKFLAIYHSFPDNLKLFILTCLSSYNFDPKFYKWLAQHDLLKKDTMGGGGRKKSKKSGGAGSGGAGGSAQTSITPFISQQPINELEIAESATTGMNDTSMVSAMMAVAVQSQASAQIVYNTSGIATLSSHDMEIAAQSAILLSAATQAGIASSERGLDRWEKRLAPVKKSILAVQASTDTKRTEMLEKRMEGYNEAHEKAEELHTNDREIRGERVEVFPKAERNAKRAAVVGAGITLWFWVRLANTFIKIMRDAAELFFGVVTATALNKNGKTPNTPGGLIGIAHWVGSGITGFGNSTSTSWLPWILGSITNPIGGLFSWFGDFLAGIVGALQNIFDTALNEGGKDISLYIGIIVAFLIALTLNVIFCHMKGTRIFIRGSGVVQMAYWTTTFGLGLVVDLITPSEKSAEWKKAQEELAKHIAANSTADIAQAARSAVAGADVTTHAALRDYFTKNINEDPTIKDHLKRLEDLKTEESNYMEKIATIEGDTQILGLDAVADVASLLRGRDEALKIEVGIESPTRALPAPASTRRARQRARPTSTERRRLKAPPTTTGQTEAAEASDAEKAATEEAASASGSATAGPTDYNDYGDLGTAPTLGAKGGGYLKRRVKSKRLRRNKKSVKRRNKKSVKRRNKKSVKRRNKKRSRRN